MYLSEIIIKNFRCFDESDNLVAFNKGLTVIVGENDSGKSAIIDAIRIVLGTTDFEWIRITPEDFHNEDTSDDIKIVCKFSDLTDTETKAFLECLTYEDNVPYLYLHWSCKFLKNFNPPRSSSTLLSGKNGNGPSIDANARELIRATYLRALRDAHSDLRSGRHSRLAQIIRNLSGVETGTDYSKDADLNNLSLIGVADLNNRLLGNHRFLKDVNCHLTKILNDQLLLTQDKLTTKFSVTGAEARDDQKVLALLGKLDLVLNKEESALRGQVGLGTSNIMSMAFELLLHKDREESSSFLLIEEPEAHIHVQRQLKVMQALEKDAESGSRQIILTTHSPLLTSVVKLSNIVMLKNGKIFPMSRGQTKLDESDYIFLEKYLDATKANLFFARSVLIVEGPSEELLLPTIAKLIGRNLTDYGVSIVNVRSTGLRRYARIFQRKDDSNYLDVPVACITDRDILPDCAPHICIDETYSDKEKWPALEKRRWRTESDFTDDSKRKYIEQIESKANGQNVKTFVSDYWTLEYDLAYCGLEDNNMHDILIKTLVAASYKEVNQEKEIDQLKKETEKLSKIEEKAATLYRYFMKDRSRKVEFAQQLAINLEAHYSSKKSEFENILPKYLVNAIKYVTGNSK